MVPSWGEDGQKRLKSARFVVAGAGGLGCPASIYLAAAGVGKLVVIDKERFELSNLNRQILVGRMISSTSRRMLWPRS